jgi:hypothetical protein
VGIKGLPGATECGNRGCRFGAPPGVLQKFGCAAQERPGWSPGHRQRGPRAWHFGHGSGGGFGCVLRETVDRLIKQNLVGSHLDKPGQKVPHVRTFDTVCSFRHAVFQRLFSF